jgi:hypothetical protein
VPGAIKIDSNQAGTGYKVLLGAPLLTALLFSFGFVIMSPAPSQQPSKVSASKPTLLITTPQPKAAAVEAAPQAKLSTVEEDEDSSLSAVMNHTKTTSPQGSGNSDKSTLQGGGNPEKGPSGGQSLLGQVKTLTNR